MIEKLDIFRFKFFETVLSFFIVFFNYFNPDFELKRQNHHLTGFRSHFYKITQRILRFLQFISTNSKAKHPEIGNARVPGKNLETHLLFCILFFACPWTFPPSVLPFITKTNSNLQKI